MKLGALENLNTAPREEALSSLRSCCSSLRWAERVLETRPFRDLESLGKTANRIWWELEPADWLEAFSSHPKIGEREAAAQASVRSAEWSAKEQAGVRDTSSDTVTALAKANREYEERFGFIFIVCASGKSAEEMLSLCRLRLSNDPDTELLIAAEEQRKITQLRLRNLISSPTVWEGSRH